MVAGLPLFSVGPKRTNGSFWFALPLPHLPRLNAIQGKASGLQVQAQLIPCPGQEPPWPSLDEDAQMAGCGGVHVGDTAALSPVQALNGDSVCLPAPGHPGCGLEVGKGVTGPRMAHSLGPIDILCRGEGFEWRAPCAQDEGRCVMVSR